MVRRQSQSGPEYLSIERVNTLEGYHTLCNNSKPAPSSVNLYVLRNPLEHDRGETWVSAAVPTTRWRSPPRAENGTTARENAASLLSRGM